ncbi:Outer membrane receptor proteins, mostly Fe transport [Mesonia phycicola]|uniref:Outer membrane receptor proteins, mostly Fe transport n=1 Tax=Mesonia phycicola TaxID=579105 RepID=A0A1M6BWL3_9FLAO|nr:TonB-dependent receptor [Mesonia phycicola]SHI52914.1 Outer membrane receptor proteins, mostly Fe transport [Mesonia phycicola]
MTQKLFLVKTLLLFVTLSLTQFSNAQEKVKVTGTVVDKDAAIPLEYATITFIDKSGDRLPQGGVTDFDGNFNVDVYKGTYDIKIEFISFETKTYNSQTLNGNLDLGTITLGINSDSLDEVVVTAETTQVEVRLDKKIYNIGKDLTTRGGTVNDALQNIPSVSVDVEGAISLRGNENVRILINGKPSAMAGFDDTTIFQQLPADAIEKVEVITSPSARYDAEGTAGILNIILKKEKTLGLNGSVNATFGYPINNSVSTTLNLRTDKFNIFNNTGVYYRKSPGNAYFDNNYFSGTYDRIIEDREYDRLRKGINTNLGIEYYLNDQSSITGTFFGKWGDDEDESESISDRYIDDALDSSTYRNQLEGEKEETYQGSVNYINNFNGEGHKLTADLQYSYDNEDKPNNIVENKTFPTNELVESQRIFENQRQNEFLLQADYVLPKGDAQFEAGFRINTQSSKTDYVLEDFDLDTQEYYLDEGQSYNFDYDENVYALYTQYGNKLGDRFSFLLGLRLEQTELKGNAYSDYLTQDELIEEIGVDFDPNFDKNYLGLFPTVNLIYEIGNDENITLGYNRRINRPRGRYINPFPSRSSTTNIFQGNPNLNPAFANTFDLGYLKKWDKLTFNTSVYYQKETDAFERIQQDTGNTNDDGVAIIRNQPINLATDERIGGEVGLIYNPTRKLRLNGSFNIFRFETEGFYEGVDYGTESTSWFGRFSAKYTLPAEIDIQTNGIYKGPTQNSQTENDAIFSLDLALSKEVIKDKLTATFNIRDVFNSRKRNSYTVSDSFTSDSEFQWRERQFTLSLIYRFNQSKEDRMKEKGRNNGAGLNEEEGDF